MKKITLISSLLVSVGLSTIASAGHHEGPTIGALEGYFCNIKDDKNMSDVMAVANEWSDWVGPNTTAQYNAWVLQPHTSNKQDFPYDYFWLGNSPSHEVMGTAQDEWMSKGTDLSKKWDEIETCGSHQLMSGIIARPFKAESKKAIVQINGCKFNDDKGLGDLMMADAEWNKKMDEADMPGGIFRWFPEAGGARDEDKDVYNIYITNTLAERGKAHDMVLHDGGASINATYGEVMTCDMPRIYTSTYVGGKNPE
ncbi:MAG: hypothetical protein P8N18_01585 [Hellea sp.]|jgi:hypothetical protein|nr:hypothetical protein [Hellea sp.]